LLMENTTTVAVASTMETHRLTAVP